MGDLLALSSRIIDAGVADEPVNRVTNELSELADGLAIVESFSHCVALDTTEGLVCFDASGAHTGAAVVEALRGWRTAPVSHLVYTHGHGDHVGGSCHFAAAAERDGHRPIHVVGHENVPVRLDRYELTNDWNLLINARQFGGVPGELNLSIGGGERDSDTLTVRVGGAAVPAARHAAAGHHVHRFDDDHRRRRGDRAAPRPRRDPTTPLAGVALDLLRVAGVGEVPDPRPPVPAAAVRRAGVRRAQRVADVRRLVGRCRVAAQADT